MTTDLQAALDGAPAFVAEAIDHLGTTLGGPRDVMLVHGWWLVEPMSVAECDRAPAGGGDQCAVQGRDLCVKVFRDHEIHRVIRCQAKSLDPIDHLKQDRTSEFVRLDAQRVETMDGREHVHPGHHRFAAQAIDHLEPEMRRNDEGAFLRRPEVERLSDEGCLCFA